MTDILLEKLSAQEHEQWEDWTKTIAKRLLEGSLWDLASGNATDEQLKEIGRKFYEQVQKWRVNWKPYSELPDEIKEYDRVYARKVIEVAKEELRKEDIANFGEQTEI
jgi:hypothetical protein